VMALAMAKVKEKVKDTEKAMATAKETAMVITNRMVRARTLRNIVQLS
jgi:hypothetical protein